MPINPGLDASGNGNNWTTNNINWFGSGSTFDVMTDVPTNTNATTANFCTWNPLVVGATITDGNLTATNSSYSDASASMSMFQSGSYYAEFTYNSATSSDALVGITLASFNGTGQSDTVRVAYQTVGQISREGVATPESLSGYPTYTAGDIIGIALNVGSGTITFYKNNTLVYTFTTSVITANEWRFFCRMSNRSFTANFGQRPFAYTPPTGFVALNTFNLPTPTIGATASTQANKYFDASLYTGNGTSQTVTNSGSMSPDFVWIKIRSGAGDHYLADTNRGISTALYTNNTDAERTESGRGVTAFNSNGFSLGLDPALRGSTNLNGATYVGWQWRGSDSIAVSNTAGSITSTVSANTTAGFSVVTYTGTGANATVGHGLGVAPRMIICKNRASVTDWAVYHASVGNTGALRLNLTAATETDSRYWNNTTPTSSVFSVGSSSTANGSGNTQVAYCFSQIAGYSAFGSYTGNGSTDGPFVFTGFRPRYVMIKRTETAGDSWILWDSARSPTNVTSVALTANLSDAEFSYSTLDLVSNGMKVRGTAGNTAVNASGSTYIYMAFAETPFNYANAR